MRMGDKEKQCRTEGDENVFTNGVTSELLFSSHFLCKYERSKKDQCTESKSTGQSKHCTGLWRRVSAWKSAHSGALRLLVRPQVTACVQGLLLRSRRVAGLCVTVLAVKPARQASWSQAAVPSLPPWMALNIHLYSCMKKSQTLNSPMLSLWKVCHWEVYYSCA